MVDMPLNSLPPILPMSRPGGLTPGGLGRPLGTTPPRAQNFSVAKLQQTRDLENSRVSMNQALRLRDENRASGAVSSIFRVGQANNAPTTSINRPAVERDAAGSMQSDAGADDRRYSYVRRLIKQRQASEGAAAAGEKSGFGVHTGSQFRGKLLHKQFGKLIRAHRATYNTIGAKERAFFEDMLKSHAAHKTTGEGFHRHDRLSMRMEVEKARQAGQLSYINAQHFKKLIDGLE